MSLYYSSILILSTLVVLLTSCQTVEQVAESSEAAKSASEKAINVQHRESREVTSSDNYARLGAAYLAKNNYEKALVKLKKSVKINNNNAKALNYLGVLYWRLEKPKLAEKYFRKSQQLAPVNSAILHNYGSFLCSEKRYKEATVLFDKVFSNPLYDRLADAYQFSASCDLDVGDLKSAEQKYKKALKLDNKNAQALLGMSKLFYKKESDKVAMYYFSRFEKVSRHTPDSLWLGINIQRILGNNNKLSSYILELKNLYPDSDQTLLLIDGKKFY